MKLLPSTGSNQVTVSSSAQASESDATSARRVLRRGSSQIVPQRDKPADTDRPAADRLPPRRSYSADVLQPLRLQKPGEEVRQRSVNEASSYTTRTHSRLGCTAPSSDLTCEALSTQPLFELVAQSASGASRPQTLERERAEMTRRVDEQVQKTGMDMRKDNPVERTHPHPLMFSTQLLNHQRRFHRLLDQALKGIVADYCSDATSEARQVVTLSPTVDRVLTWANESSIPYAIGSHRPDTLFGANNDFKMCEINARFTTNCFITAHLANDLFQHTDYLRGAGLRSMESLQGIPDVFSKKFPNKSKEVILLQDGHHIDDIVIFPDMMKQAGHKVRTVSPDELQVIDGRLCDGAGKRLDYVVVDLYQRELERLPEQTLRALMKCESCLNDLRTIFIVHDKRLLAVLSNPELVRRYLPTDEAARFLCKHVCETYVLDRLPRGCPDFANEREQWVIKPYRSGAGDGVAIGKSMTQQAWQERLDRGMKNGEVIQRYTVPKQLRVSNPRPQSAAYRDAENVQVSLAGVMPLFDGRFCAPGMTRMNDGDVVNMSNDDGGFAMFAAEQRPARR